MLTPQHPLQFLLGIKGIIGGTVLHGVEDEEWEYDGVECEFEAGDDSEDCDDCYEY
jgi:hypothetical protein